jgi:hypothetical protein
MTMRDLAMAEMNWLAEMECYKRIKDTGRVFPTADWFKKCMDKLVWDETQHEALASVGHLPRDGFTCQCLYVAYNTDALPLVRDRLYRYLLFQEHKCVHGKYILNSAQQEDGALFELTCQMRSIPTEAVDPEEWNRARFPEA